jgi:hypothetical protein
MAFWGLGPQKGAVERHFGQPAAWRGLCQTYVWHLEASFRLCSEAKDTKAEDCKDAVHQVGLHLGSAFYEEVVASVVVF